MNRLRDIGFIKVGEWELNNDKIKYQLTSHEPTKNVLYTFVINDVIKYIGKTTMQVRTRMYGYQNPGPSQRTNIRIHGEIREELKSLDKVDIYILVDNGLLKYGNFKINLAAGLEDTLIYDINPEWNFVGKRIIKEDEESDNEELHAPNGGVRHCIEGKGRC